MITRFDHIVIGVRDLDAAMQHFQWLGFDVRPGGKHTGLGTYNALIRFGLDYIELIAVYDKQEVAASSWRNTILEYLSKREELLLGYALATDTIGQEAERLRAIGLLVEEPFAMQRMRPDGRLLTWRLLLPGGVSWRRPWPFLIQWDAPDSERLSWEVPGTHANGAVTWVRVAVAVRDLEKAVSLYQQQLGLELLQRDTPSRLSASRATFRLGNSTIDLLQPTGAGPVQDMLQELGEGPFEFNLAVNDLSQTRAFLAQQNIGFETDAGGPETLLVSPDQMFGLRLLFSQKAE